MKLTEMIMRLNALLDEHGNVEVLSDSADGGLPVEIEGVHEVVDDDGKRSKALFLHGLETIEAEEEGEKDDIETGAGGA